MGPPWDPLCSRVGSSGWGLDRVAFVEFVALWDRFGTRPHGTSTVLETRTKQNERALRGAGHTPMNCIRTRFTFGSRKLIAVWVRRSLTSESIQFVQFVTCFTYVVVSVQRVRVEV